MSNIEEDIKIINNFLQNIENGFIISKEISSWEPEKRIAKAIEHLLAEREEDKKKIDKLQVLEDDLKDKRIVYVDTPEFEEKFIPKQKVKDKFNKLITRIKEFKDPEIKKYFSIEQIIELLEQFKNKFLEDK